MKTKKVTKKATKTINHELVKKFNDVPPTDAALTEILWQSLKDVQSQKLQPIQANAIARLSKEMLGISKLKLEYAKFTGQKVVKDTLMLS